MLHMLFRMLPVSLLVCLLLRMLFRTLLVVYAPLRSAQSNRPPDDLSLPACLLLHMLFSYLWPQVVLLDQPLFQTLKNSVNCMIAFLPHALAASVVTILFWGLVILCMPLGLLLMLVFGFWFQVEVCCQIVYGDLDRVFHIEEKIQKLHDAELEAELAAERGEDEE